MLVMKISSRFSPFWAKTLFRNFPALPTNGLPVLSSSVPGFCPTSMSFAFCGPSPGTACLAHCQSRHFRQLQICLFKSLSVRRFSPLWLMLDSHTTLKAFFDIHLMMFRQVLEERL